MFDHGTETRLMVESGRKQALISINSYTDAVAAFNRLALIKGWVPWNEQKIFKQRILQDLQARADRILTRTNGTSDPERWYGQHLSNMVLFLRRGPGS